MILSITILALITAQRLGELVLARHNTRALKAAGAVRPQPTHQPVRPSKRQTSMQGDSELMGELSPVAG